MRKTVVWCLLLCLLSFFPVFAGGSQEDESGEESVTIEFLQWFAEEIGHEVFDEIINDFEAENPGISVELVNMPFGKVRETIIQNNAVGVGADVLAVNPPWVTEFVSMGILEPLDNYYSQASNTIKKDDLVSLPAIDGSPYLVPLTSLPFVLFYNEDLMSANGITKVPETWDELRDAALKITNEDENQYGLAFAMSVQAPTNSPIVEVYPLLYTAGGRTIKSDGTSNIESPEMRATLEFIETLNEDGVLNPGIFSKLSNTKVEDFATGRIGFMIMASNHITSVRRNNPDLNFGVAPVPYLSKRAYRLLGWDVAIAEASENKEEAWKFIEFLARPEYSEKIAKASSMIPGNVNADTSFLDEDPLLQTVSSIIQNDEAVEELMLTPNAAASWEIFTLEMQKLLKGAQSVDETIKAIDAGWDELFE